MEAMGPTEELPVATLDAAAATSVTEDQLKRRAIVFSLAGSNEGGKKTALEAEMPKLKYSEVAARSAGFTPEEERMMVEHLPTVRYIARRIHERLPQHVDIEDLVSAGVLGLMDAFQKFNPGKNVQFRSYAQFRIRGAILDSLRTLDWSPRDLRRKGRAIEQAMRSLTARLGRAPSEQEIADELQMGLGDYQQLLGELKGLEIGTLHLERSEDSGEEELAYIPNRPEDDPLFRCLQGEMKQRLAEAIGNLPERERLVMTLYYYEELTMKEIGLTLGVVESRISQIHASAVLHLRGMLADLAAKASGMKTSGTSKAQINSRAQINQIAAK
jgi:RNA polymerase sigma factor for flagellar operon FliA